MEEAGIGRVLPSIPRLNIPKPTGPTSFPQIVVGFGVMVLIVKGYFRAFEVAMGIGYVMPDILPEDVLNAATKQGGGSGHGDFQT